MTERAYWKPNGRIVAMPFKRLGETGKGTWGLVEDGGWIARPDAAALELLYFSEAEYRHAMRRLPPREVALAVEHRRKAFWQPLPEQACRWIQKVMWRCIDRTDNDERGLRLRRGLLTLHAKLVDVDRLDERTQDQLDWLNRRDAELLDDLECQSLQQVYPIDADGKERAFRQQFIAGLVRLQTGREMRPEEQLGVSVYRGYAVRVVTGELRRRARLTEMPTMRWGDMLLMGLCRADVAALRTHEKQLIFARATELLQGAEMTPAQFDVELSERLAGPDLYPHFMAFRIGTASMREAVRLVNRANREVEGLLAKQVEDELQGLALFRKLPPAKPSLDDLVAELLAVIDLLAAIVLRREGVASAAEYKNLARDVRKLLEEDGR